MPLFSDMCIEACLYRTIESSLLSLRERVQVVSRETHRNKKQHRGEREPRLAASIGIFLLPTPSLFSNWR